jgi:chromosome segregation ATPase
MQDRAALADAATRLAAALDALEAAVARRRANEDTVRELEDDVHLLAVDRAKLARALDDALARGAALDAARAEASRRLESATAVVADVLASNGG